ncbi:MAG: MFS transporter, partial [Pseudolabrys sp.]
MASQRSLRGLDWFAFFVADVQTGWGPFVATYLTSVAWTQFDIGLILTIGTITGLALQIPAGALVDRAPVKRLLAALAVASISASALLLALWPIFSVVVAAKVLHAIASSLLGPTLVAMSLGLVGHALFSIRLGRNVRFLSLGNAIAAGVAGGIAYYYSNQAIFFLTAALGIPTLIALAQISSSEIDPELARGGISKSGVDTWFDAISGLVHHRVLIGFAATIVLFQLANAAMLPILAGILAKRDPETAALVLSICILVPQFVVVAIAPWIGVTAQSWGRRPLLLLTFVALSAR